MFNFQHWENATVAGCHPGLSCLSFVYHGIEQMHLMFFTLHIVFL